MALLAVLVMACSQGQPTASNQGQPTAGNLVTPSPSSCKLPISIADSGGNLQGGFINYASGILTIDPNGANGAYYDRAFSRWLPVNQSAVTPDGSRYAYLDRKVPGTSAPQWLHLIDLTTGSEKRYEVAPTDSPSGYRIISLATEGVWLSYAGYEGPRRGLFLLDLTTGRWKDVGGQQMILDAVSGGPGVFWFTDGGPNPEASGIGFVIPARLNRLTIEDSKTLGWYTKDGSGLTVFGTDLAGHPIFGTSDPKGGFEVWIARAPGEATKIDLPAGFYQVFADAQGVWFGGDQGIYLYSGASVQKVSDQKGAPAGTCA
jgi:hypothetical protein